jgi:hypothetical protein
MPARTPNRRQVVSSGLILGSLFLHGRDLWASAISNVLRRNTMTTRQGLSQNACDEGKTRECLADVAAMYLSKHRCRLSHTLRLSVDVTTVFVRAKKLMPAGL